MCTSSLLLFSYFCIKDSQFAGLVSPRGKTPSSSSAEPIHQDLSLSLAPKTARGSTKQRIFKKFKKIQNLNTVFFSFGT